jgi:hypothetical protein
VSIDPQSGEEKIWKPAGQQYDPKKYLSSDMQELNEENEKKSSEMISDSWAKFEFSKSQDRRRFLNNWFNNAEQECKDANELDDLDWQIQQVERNYDEDVLDQLKIERALFKEVLFDRYRSNARLMGEDEAKAEAKEILKICDKSTLEYRMAQEYLLSFEAQHEEAFKKSYSQDNRRSLLQKQRVRLLEMALAPEKIKFAQERWNAFAKDRESQL